MVFGDEGRGGRIVDSKGALNEADEAPGQAADEDARDDGNHTPDDESVRADRCANDEDFSVEIGIDTSGGNYV